MPAVGLHDDTYEKLRLLAKAWSITEGEVVSRLLMEFQRSDRRTVDDDREGVSIHAVYEGIRIEATFTPETHRITIITGALSGQSFKSPSGAAVALVGALNPTVKPNRSGWSFWTISKSGQLLHTLRHR